jgi:hypothetical protein
MDYDVIKIALGTTVLYLKILRNCPFIVFVDVIIAIQHGPLVDTVKLHGRIKPYTH